MTVKDFVGKCMNLAGNDTITLLFNLDKNGVKELSPTAATKQYGDWKVDTFYLNTESNFFGMFVYKEEKPW